MVTTILQWAYNEVLLGNLIFSIEYSQIDSLKDLADSQLPFMVFQGESVQEYIEQENNEMIRKLRLRYVVEDPSDEKKEQWEIDTFKKISAGKYAMVCDQPFLDYYYALKLARYPNLHRSQQNFLSLPYYIPMSKHNSKELKGNFTQLYVIYNLNVLSFMCK